jgi:predicted AAA+ superfamily ATPase
MYLARDLYLKKIDPFIDKQIIKILTGIRRCGKSIMLLLIQEELRRRGVDSRQIISMNFDTFEADFGLTAEQVYKSIKATQAQIPGKLYLFLDEVQELEGWERLANSCLTELDADIYVTGSNSKMLSKEYASLLTGRYVMFTIYPFSFAETQKARELAGNDLSPQEAFTEYIKYGGMPFIMQLGADDHSIRQYLHDVAEAIISKDITERFNVRDVDQLKRLILFLFSNVGNIFSANSVQKYLHSDDRTPSWETIVNYIDYCKTAYLLLPAAQENVTGKRLLRVQEKLYLTDHGFREALLGTNTQNAAQVLENIVYIELLRHDYVVHIGKIDKQEIDFVAEKNGRKLYFQVCYLLATEEIASREFSAFDAVSDSYPKYVISLDTLDMSRGGIEHLNLIEFLSNPNATLA